MADKNIEIQVTPPNFQTAVFRIRGTAPYVQNKFSTEARQEMEDKQTSGSLAKKGKARAAKNLQEDYLHSMYETAEGWRGIPAMAFTKSMISACRTVDFKMTLAKLSIRVSADGYDPATGTALVKIIKGQPRLFKATPKNANGNPDVRIRAMWAPGWEAAVTVLFDADMFSVQDITNLLYRAGQQCGVGDGRPDSPRSAGCGWGVFEIVKETTAKKSI